METLRVVHFVTIVRGYEELYMREHPLYGDRGHRHRIWNEIGTIVNEPAEVCKKRWVQLRQTYLYHTRQAKRSADAEKYWAARPAHARLMSFLDAADPARLPTTKAPAPETEDSSDSDNMLGDKNYHSFDVSNSVSSDEDQGPSCSKQASSVPQESQPDHDDTEDFFAELGDSLNDFPEGVKIDVKRKVFNIVIDAEEMLHNKKLQDELQAQMNISEEQE